MPGLFVVMNLRAVIDKTREVRNTDATVRLRRAVVRTTSTFVKSQRAASVCLKSARVGSKHRSGLDSEH